MNIFRMVIFRKILIMTISLIILLGFNNITFAADNPEIYFYIDGKKVEGRKLYKAEDNGDIFVPVADIVSKLGGKIEDNRKQGKGLKITNNGQSYIFDSTNYYTDGNSNFYKYDTKTKSRFVYGVFYIPYNTLNKLFGYELTIKENQVFLGAVPDKLPVEKPVEEPKFVDLLPKDHPQYGSFERTGQVGGDYNWVNGGYNITRFGSFQSMPFDGVIDNTVISKFDSKMVKAFEDIYKLVKENCKRIKSEASVMPKFGYPGIYNKYTFIDNNWIIPMLKSKATKDPIKDFKTLSDELQIPLSKDSEGIWYSSLNQETVNFVMGGSIFNNKVELTMDSYFNYKYSPYMSKQDYIFPQILKFYFPTNWELLHKNLVGARSDFKDGKEYDLTLDGKKVKIKMGGSIESGRSFSMEIYKY